MSGAAPSLRIVHLFPHELGINGDVGNVTVLAERARARGIAAEIVHVARGDSLPEADAIDIVHIGSGPLPAALLVLPDVQRHGVQLREVAAAGAPFVAISAGWGLLGRAFTTPDGHEHTGAEVFPTVAVHTGRQAVGATVLTSPLGTIAGFANHDSITTLDDGAQPLGTVVRGFGNGGAAAAANGGAVGGAAGAAGEGIVHGDSIGSHLHGALLALNPQLADRVLAAALRRRNPGSELPDPPPEQASHLAQLDEWSRRAREAFIGRTGAGVRA